MITLKGILFRGHKFLRSVNFFDFASIKFHDFEPNLHFVSIKFHEKKELWNHIKIITIFCH